MCFIVARVIAPEDLLEIPVGSVIYVGKKLDPDSHWGGGNGSVWYVSWVGKASLMGSRFPYSETEDLDWFAPWEVSVLLDPGGDFAE